MGCEPDQVGSSGEGIIGKVAIGGPRLRTGGKQFPGKKKKMRNNPRKIRSTFTGISSELSGYVLDTTQSKQIQSESYMKTAKELKMYIGSNYSGGDNVCKFLDKLIIINLSKPTKPTSPSDERETYIYKHEIKTYVKRRDHTR